jgi:acyl-CoA reductase-like NAD-dependent aldehyde dehydrogenase
MEYLTSYDPSNGEVVGKIEVTPLQKLDRVVKNAKKAQKEWASVDIEERIKLLEKAGTELSHNVQELGLLLSREMGKDLRRSTSEVYGCGSDIRYRGEEVKNAIKTQIFKSQGYETQMQYNPLGVCGIIAPWNYPMSMAHWMIIPALTAGNTVIYKPSEETPLIADAYVKIFQKYLPKNVLQLFVGADKHGEALVKSDINFIGFTGSQEVGKKIMENSAKGLKRLIMELGGKDPLIVMKDADLNRAAQFAVANSLENAGQMCVATERIYVDKSIAEKFEKKVIEITKRYRVGSWQDQYANVGPIINSKQRERILNQIDEAVSKGAKIIAGGKDHPQGFINPTILTDVTDDMKVFNEETFGPIIAIQKFSNIEEAIEKANNSTFGLGAAIFGNKNVDFYANQIESGMIGINQGIGGIGDVPWVGAKQSGYGYHGSPDGHRQFTQVRIISKRS